MPRRKFFQKQRQNKDFFRHAGVEFTSSRPALQKMLKEVLQADGKSPLVEMWIHTKEGRAPEMINMWSNRKDFSYYLSVLKS